MAILQADFNLLQYIVLFYNQNHILSIGFCEKFSKKALAFYTKNMLFVCAKIQLVVFNCFLALKVIDLVLIIM